MVYRLPPAAGFNRKSSTGIGIPPWCGIFAHNVRMKVRSAGATPAIHGPPRQCRPCPRQSPLFLSCRAVPPPYHCSLPQAGTRVRRPAWHPERLPIAPEFGCPASQDMDPAEPVATPNGETAQSLTQGLTRFGFGSSTSTGSSPKSPKTRTGTQPPGARQDRGRVPHASPPPNPRPIPSA